MPKKNIVILLLFGLFVVISLLYIDPNTIIYEPVVQTQKEQARSIDLRKRIINQGNQVITQYENDNGELIYAADLRYARKVLTKTATGSIELYYDEEGNPARNTSGYYGLIIEYNAEGQETRRTFLGLDQKPIICYEGYAIIEIIYNDAENSKTIYFFDEKGEPVCTSAFGCGKKSEFDKNGRAQKVTYLNSIGEPMVTQLGYSSILYTYYSDDSASKGKIEYEYYFDASGQSISLALGEYGVHREYDSDGNNSVITYLDSDGNPIITNEGYTTVRRTFFKNNYVETETYYDIKGEPYDIGEGQYGTQKLASGKEIHLDERGNVIFNIKNLLDRYPFLIVVFALALLILSSTANNRMNWAFMAIYLVCIVYLTLLYRRAKETYTFYNLFRSYSQLFTNAEIRAGILKNIWLFIPLGTILHGICPKKTVLLIPIAISVLIELIQHFASVGYCELDDVISNGLGGMIGYEMGKLLIELKGTMSKRRRKLK